MGFWKRWLPQSPRAPSRYSARPYLEALESRIVPYNVAGGPWPHPNLVTISFVPDGTNLGGGDTSNLFSVFNGLFGSPSTWENLILKAAQTWAQQTNVNFAVVPDNGTPFGGGNYQQGDPGMGDIRIGGYNFGNSTLAYTELPPPVNNFSIAGDIQFNTAAGWHINGAAFDLLTVAVHEMGHALGLGESSINTAVMYGMYNGTKRALASDDIQGIQSIYGARTPSQYEPDYTFATATPITSLINSSLTAQLFADVTAVSDTDYYLLVAPVGSSSTLTVQVQSQGLSLLAPDLYVYNGSETLLGSASGVGQYGTTLTVSVGGITAGSTYYIEVTGADSTAFGTGAYALTLNLGTGSLPSVPLPNTETPNGSPLHAGGGQAQLSPDGSGTSDNGAAPPGLLALLERLQSRDASGTSDDAAPPVAAPATTTSVASLVSGGPTVLIALAAGVQETPVPAAVVFLSPPGGPAAVPGPATPLLAAPTHPVLNGRVDSGSAENPLQLPDELVPDDMPPASDSPASAPGLISERADHPAAAVPSSAALWRAASTACFEQESATVGSVARVAAATPPTGEQGAATLDSGAAAAALAVVLGGYWVRQQEETTTRRQWQPKT